LRRASLDKELDEEYRNKKTKKKQKKGKARRVFTGLFMLGTVCCILGIFLLYGPYAGFRDWLITTAEGTMTHKYLATWFFDDETINDCMRRNSITEVSGSTDTSAISIGGAYDPNATYENEYEEAVLKRNANNNDYKIIQITGEKFSGYMAVIYDPSRIKTVVTSKIGEIGEYLTEMSEKNNALVAINAGGFADENGDGTGGTPSGITISNGKIITDNAYVAPNGQKGGLIGFNKENILVIGSYSASQAKAVGIRDAVTFSPFLMLNGEVSNISGNGGGGRASRTAIAQRADGIVLFLVLDGNRTLGQGATYEEEIEILKNYGAVNAANLDGGTSTSMTVHSCIVNNPTNLAGSHRTRQVATAFILEADASDNGDYSIVANKVTK
jgi:exopolysaccharide biosynthesis protein